MNTFSRIGLAAAFVVTSPMPLAAPASAHSTTRYHTHRIHGKTHYAHRYCSRSSGSTGLVAGGVGGAVVGHSVLGHGVLGTVGGAVGGAIAGRAIDRSMTAHRRCYWR